MKGPCNGARSFCYGKDMWLTLPFRWAFFCPDRAVPHRERVWAYVEDEGRRTKDESNGIQAAHGDSPFVHSVSELAIRAIEALLDIPQGWKFQGAVGPEVGVGVTVATTKRTSFLPVVQRGQTYCAEEPLSVALPPPGIGVTPMTTSLGAA